MKITHVTVYQPAIPFRAFYVYRNDQNGKRSAAFEELRFVGMQCTVVTYDSGAGDGRQRVKHDALVWSPTYGVTTLGEFSDYDMDAICFAWPGEPQMALVDELERLKKVLIKRSDEEGE